MKVFKAVKSSYIALGLPWFVLLLLYIYLFFTKPYSNVTSVCWLLSLVLLIIVIWLKGFRIIITEEYISYRDGLYRTKTIPLSDIKVAKSAWVEFGRFNKNLKIPRFLITSIHGDEILINDKPFSHEAIQALNDLKK